MPLTDQQEKWVQEVVAYLSTDEGKAALKEAARKATEFSEELERARQLDWRIWYEPVTI